MTRTGELLTTAQVAELLGIDVASVNRAAQIGYLATAMKLPGRTGPRLFHPDAVEVFRQKREADKPRREQVPA